jgi:nucleoid-associated protein YgaU
MKQLAPTLLIASVTLLSSPFVLAESQDNYINSLGNEAKSTSMKNHTVTKETEAEPDVVPDPSVNIDQLTSDVANKLKKALGQTETDSSTSQDETKIQDAVENVVSTALQEGNKMDDIRNAVSAAMSDLSNPDTESELKPETVETASKALKKIVGENKEIATGDSTDNYIKSLNAELETKTAPPPEAATTITAAEPPGQVTKSYAASDSTASDNNTLERTITVLKGESLYKIALRVYGSGDHYMKIYNANRDIIYDPNIVQVGSILRVPAINE